MGATDVTETLDQALAITGVDQVRVKHRPRLLSDNGPATASGHRIRQSGPVTMPTLLFEEDPNLEKGRCFSGEAALRGSLLHPTWTGS